jgi:hypothetical protein
MVVSFALRAAAHSKPIPDERITRQHQRPVLRHQSHPLRSFNPVG